ncbi:inverse autotransporter beta domain-containing protein [Zooshikella harenae]|uniref:Inverse autotransporter beta domain-containing protein n=1 Tax=Zooshikella harenae TaxID=2827238 RepID=A0ABS5Z7S8_9GAMM|nr:inverse autotransporter beta domain-containing protein [Zooshikella harenae]MBU2710106.1 inverse autotransporter beta domain-containing protein [Zooshikella harenae]
MKKPVLACLPMLSFLVTTPVLSDDNPAQPSLVDKWDAWVAIDGLLTSDEDALSVDSMLPVYEEDDGLVFIKLDASKGKGNYKSYSVGSGYRHMLDDEQIIGIYGFLDYQQSENGNGFHQFNLGAEYRTVDWDFGANLYLPVGGRKKKAGSHTVTGADGRTYVEHQYERILQGADVEVGYRLPFFTENEEQQLRLYTGVYHFKGEQTKSFTGQKLRLEYHMENVINQLPGSQLTLGSGAKHDSVTGNEGFVFARFTLPFDFMDSGAKRNRLSPFAKRMTERVRRQPGIVAIAEPEYTLKDDTSEPTFPPEPPELPELDGPG